jgi:hypothetical protein
MLDWEALFKKYARVTCTKLFVILTKDGEVFATSHPDPSDTILYSAMNEKDNED